GPSDTTPTALSPLSLHDALPICTPPVWFCGISSSITNERKRSTASRSPRIIRRLVRSSATNVTLEGWSLRRPPFSGVRFSSSLRSEEHTSELQSRENLVCRLLLE